MKLYITRARQTAEITVDDKIKLVFARSKAFLDRVKSENPKDAKVLVIAHGTLLKTLHFNLVGYDDSTDLSTFHLENCALAEYDI